jgi:curved DNA-binding protein
MEFIDYYKVLGLNKNATEKEIKDAYRKLARKYHPDLNPNDKEANKNFQRVNEANEVLSDPEKRKKYDQYGKDWKHAEEFEKARQHREERSYAGGPGGAFSGDFNESDFSDFFQSMFGGERRGWSGSKVRYRGEDYHAEMQLSLLGASQTQKQTISIGDKKIRITIPAGVENGQTIKIKGHGSPGINGGPAGDLYITFSVLPDPKFRREGNDLHLQVDLDLYKAVLGGEIMIDTLSGQVKVTVKPETQNGTKIRLKGKGFPVYKREGEFGDLYITYSLSIPMNLSDKEKALFAELSRMRP